MSSSLRMSTVFLAGLLAAGALEGAALPAAAASSVRALEADRIGVDHAGNLWAWNRGRSALYLLDRTGEIRHQFPVERFRSLDAHVEYGVVLLDPTGLSLTVLDPAGGNERSIPLGNPAADVVWLSPEKVAVSTTRAPLAIEIWDLVVASPVEQMAPSPAIEPKAGAAFLRSWRLEYDPDRELVFALDSLKGTLRVYSLAGEVRHRAEIPSRRLAEFREWLEEIDAKAKSSGTINTPLMTYLQVALDEEGTAWVVEHCDRKRDRLVLAKVPPGQDKETVELPLRDECCSTDFAVWRDTLVMLGTRDSEPTRCTDTRRIHEE